MIEGSSEGVTERQRECLLLVYTHHTIAEISTKLGISVEGVNYHLGGARKALGATSSAQAARILYGHRRPDDYISHVAVRNVVAKAEDSNCFEPSPDAQATPPLVEEDRAVFDSSLEPPVLSPPTLKTPQKDDRIGETVKLVLDWVCRVAGVVLMILFLAYAFSNHAHHQEDLLNLRHK